MVTTHNLGYPRIGAQRELKFGLESYWHGKTTQAMLLALGEQLRNQHWQDQQHIDLVPVGDFSFYDQVLDTSALLGNLPTRGHDIHGTALDHYFRVARGRSAVNDICTCGAVQAGEMTKWFDTNYHYIVPEFSAATRFALQAEQLLQQVREAQATGLRCKPVIIGPVTYLWLGKARDGSNRLQLLDQLLAVYAELLDALHQAGVEWVQVDEPLLTTDLDTDWTHAFNLAYHQFKSCKIRIMLTTYFGALQDNLHLACSLPVAGLHVDALASTTELAVLPHLLAPHKVLSLGVINGRNIWKADLNAALDLLEPLHERLQDRLWIAPTCSLLHVPVDLDRELALDPEIKSWLAFARQKLHELQLLSIALNQGRTAVQTELDQNRAALASRRTSSRVHNPAVQTALAQITAQMGQRASPFVQRTTLQAKCLQLPLYPTTTIGSFPQTAEIRHTRNRFRHSEIDVATYQAAMQTEIQRSVLEQENLGLDVLVHGEAERNDMVEYFGEQLEGFAQTSAAWVQSYGSRCVKPPILYGDVSRPRAMTVDWIRYAQSLTDKPVKGMLTGPVTILNWSFVRDDQPRATTCRQLALAIREEVLDLERAGIRVIQIDEAALREGLPLRVSQWTAYLDWAVESFRIAANGVADQTQIHTHMCYAEFNDILPAIASMDADVITIETSRSDMELLDAFDRFRYPNQIGPGVYDIHSPNVPSRQQIVDLMTKAAQRIPPERLWVNPDCGLKTRQWEEVLPALRNLVAAARELRKEPAAVIIAN